MTRHSDDVKKTQVLDVIKQTKQDDVIQYRKLSARSIDDFELIKAFQNLRGPSENAKHRNPL